MTRQLRPYQVDLKQGIRDAWDGGARDVLAVLPAGGGKTSVFSEIIRENRGASCAIAHRQELVSQMSCTLATNGVTHRVIGPDSLIRSIVGLHMNEFGRSFYDPQALCAVAGVDTLIKRGKQLEKWLPSVTLAVTDEGHHLASPGGAPNKWVQGRLMMPEARHLAVTATPLRSDGLGLGRHADGVIDKMVVGPSARWLIDQGYLTDYKIFAPESDIDLSAIPISPATGDFNKTASTDAVRKSSIVGDVVKNYKRIADGKLTIVFTTDIETASKMESDFRATGIPAEMVHAKSTKDEREGAMRRFRDRETLVLINVDLYGEGVDVPAVECVIMARPTDSYGLFVQQFNRATRPVYAPGYDLSDREGRLAAIAASHKPYAIIIDHVHNVMYPDGELHHGLPDAERQWSLDRRDRKQRSAPDDAIKLRTCPECIGAYPRHMSYCLHCGAPAPEPTSRGAPEFVDGDLRELDPAVLQALRERVAQVDQPVEEAAALYRDEMIAKGAPHIGVLANTKRFAAKHADRQAMIGSLRDVMSEWAGHHRAHGRDDGEIYRRFWLTFGTDWMTAQTLDADQMLGLLERVACNVGKG